MKRIRAGLLGTLLVANAAGGAWAQDAALIGAAQGVAVTSLDSTQPKIPLEDWLSEVGRVPRSLIHWEVNDCGEGGDGRAAPTCVEAGLDLAPDLTAYASLIVAGLDDKPTAPAIWMLSARTGSKSIVFKGLSEWAAFMRARVALRRDRPPEPAGLAAATLADTSFRWLRRGARGFRVYFARGSYAAAHEDSLLARLPSALAHALELIGASPLGGPIDVFFIESRSQMATLTGAPVTGFAKGASRTVLLVTNAGWRAFERHEVMHVVARQTWGLPASGNAWLEEGLAQAADGMCAGYANAEVAAALAARRGWIPLEAVLTRFREQPDVRAYLQAAAFAGFLLRSEGAREVENLWRRGANSATLVGGTPLSVLEQRWKEGLARSREVPPATLAAVESKGCG